MTTEEIIEKIRLFQKEIDRYNSLINTAQFEIAKLQRKWADNVLSDLLERFSIGQKVRTKKGVEGFFYGVRLEYGRPRLMISRIGPDGKPASGTQWVDEDDEIDDEIKEWT